MTSVSAIAADTTTPAQLLLVLLPLLLPLATVTAHAGATVVAAFSATLFQLPWRILLWLLQLWQWL